jgi:putative PIN family toxin of toxin-antitoxin system
LHSFVSRAAFPSPEVRTELTEVLHRPQLQKKFKTLTPERVEAFLRDLAGKAISLLEVPKQFTYPRDPDDECSVNLALAAGATYLVTWDNDLLDLLGENPEGAGFRGRFPGLRILTPVVFLHELALPPAAPPATAGPAEPPTG